MPKLTRSFFNRDPLTCAAELIGCELVWDGCAGIIVETEAYAEFGDEASHTFSRPSTRRFIAERVSGTAYVYLNYGMYWLLNVLTLGGGENNGLILIRAIEPTRGIEKMRRRRALNRTSKIKHQTSLASLCSGPGKLGVALGVTGEDHGLDLCASAGRYFRPRKNRNVTVVNDVRIGISSAQHLPWRFLFKDSPFVSKPPGSKLAGDRIA